MRRTVSISALGLMSILIVLIHVQCKKDDSGKLPHASVTVAPNSGDMSTVFYFDATRSKAGTGSGSKLEVRWDWNSDGVWDWPYTQMKHASFQFSQAKTHSVKAEIKNEKGEVSSKSINIVVNAGGVATEPCPDMPVITYQGQVYNTVKIGTQCWMKENLNAGTFIKSSTAQKDNGTLEKYCYNDLEANCVKFGGLYQWNELMQYSTTADEGICPPGWSIPSEQDWNTLITYLGGDIEAGGKLKEAGTMHWDSPNTNANNAAGFAALPNGLFFIDSKFYEKGASANFWSSTPSGPNAWNITLFGHSGESSRTNNNRACAFSVRCFK